MEAGNQEMIYLLVIIFVLVKCEQPEGWPLQAALTTSSMKGCSTVAESNSSTAIGLKTSNVFRFGRSCEICGGSFVVEREKAPNGLPIGGDRDDQLPKCCPDCKRIMG